MVTLIFLCNPDTTINISLNVLKVVSKIIPKKDVIKLREKGIDTDQMSDLQNNGIKGKLVEIKENEKTVISIE